MSEFAQAAAQKLKKHPEVAQERLLHYNQRNKIRAIRNHVNRLLEGRQTSDYEIMFIARHLKVITEIPKSKDLADLPIQELEALLAYLGNEIFKAGFESYGGLYSQFATKR
jgi:hypothetical protein